MTVIDLENIGSICKLFKTSSLTFAMPRPISPNLAASPTNLYYLAPLMAL
jgi:hypothetical protein